MNCRLPQPRCLDIPRDPSLIAPDDLIDCRFRRRSQARVSETGVVYIRLERRTSASDVCGWIWLNSRR